MTTDYANFIGNGFAFPFEIAPTGKVEDLVTDSEANKVERVRQSIMQILATQVGERFFLRDFGSRLHELVFEPNDMVLVGMARTFVIQAIERWEKRLILVSVEPIIDRPRATLFIKVEFRLRESAVEGSLVFPFFISGLV